jgi:hypothetical protein
VPVALPLVGGFAVGLAFRARLQDHFATAFRVQFGFGLGALAVLAGWAFDGGVSAVTALGLLLVAQLSSVGLAAWLFRRRREGPVLAFGMFGNPTFWSLPIVAATLGPEPAVVIAAYDMLTLPRIAVGVKLLRSRAPVRQAARTALADYAPMAGAVVGLALGAFVEAPEIVPELVGGLGTVLAATSSILLGVVWPRAWLGRAELGPALRALAMHLTFVPGVMAAGLLAGLDIPPAVWVLALGPLPVASLSFARLYGYSVPQASTAFALSVVSAVALLPLAIALGGG